MAEIYFKRRKDCVRIWAHCYVKRAEFKTKRHQRWLDEESKLFRFVFRKGRYKRIRVGSVLRISVGSVSNPMITQKEVEHIARLARIELSEAEKAKFEKELAGILKFVEKLNAVDTSQVSPLTGGTDLANVMREDKPSADSAERIADSPPRLVEVAPKKRDGYVEVKAVFERE